MFTIPANKKGVFISALEEKGIPRKNRGAYLKWVKFFLDFCNKYHFDEKSRESLAPFIKKLPQKRQTVEQQKQASEAIILFLSFTPGSFKNKKEVGKNGQNLSSMTGGNKTVLKSMDSVKLKAGGIINNQKMAKNKNNPTPLSAGKNKDNSFHNGNGNIKSLGSPIVTPRF